MDIRREVATASEVAAGENQRTTDQACPVLLVAAGGGSSDATALWQHALEDRGAAAAGGIADCWVADIIALREQQGRDQCVKNPSPRAAEWACEGVEGSNRAHLRLPGAGHDRQPGRDLTLGSLRGYESGVWKVKTEIPDIVGRSNEMLYSESNACFSPVCERVLGLGS